MSRPEIQVENELKARLPKGSGLLLAVSGGADSCVLLQAAHKLSRLLELKLEVAHVDHQLRASSKRDALFVKKSALALKLPFHLKRLSKAPTAQNLEAWCRGQRYQFFNEILKKRKLGYVVTAHTASDVAETFLMRLVSNKELASIECFDQRRKLIRPLLNVTREKIESYAAKNKVKFMHDETNDDQRYLRNKVRKSLIPYLAKNYDKRIVETIAERAQAIAADQAELYALSEAALERVNTTNFGSKLWLRELKAELSSREEGLRWRIVERMMRNKLGFNLGRAHSKRLLDFVLGKATGIELPGGVVITKKDGGLAFRT